MNIVHCFMGCSSRWNSFLSFTGSHPSFVHVVISFEDIELRDTSQCHCNRALIVSTIQLTAFLVLWAPDFLFS